MREEDEKGKTRRMSRFLVLETKEKGKPICEIGNTTGEHISGGIYYSKCLQDLQNCGAQKAAGNTGLLIRCGNHCYRGNRWRQKIWDVSKKMGREKNTKEKSLWNTNINLLSSRTFKCQLCLYLYNSCLNRTNNLNWKKIENWLSL